ncbi:GNAT family N-acetyltransferase [Streptomyces sp. enrichment culture]|uniref:GNAT family N-acetyltransferase n=1 Tax=Streptomyces sp. enrichment culture TaxID=1795815 RepID=UPI003F554675
MMRGEKVGLRARHSEDIPVFQAELYNDVVTRTRVDSRPWVPVPQGTEKTPNAAGAQVESATPFSVVELETGELAGEAGLWGIDTHNRLARLGISLRPAFRGRGLATDVVRVLCAYGFAVRGLRRLQIETLADNAPMIATARRAGFTLEGTLRSSAWVYGGFADEVILGLLAEEWRE